MTGSRARAMATVIAGLTLRIMPPGQGDWAKAMLHESGAIEPGPDAILFALGCVRGALVAAARDRVDRILHRLMPASSSRPSGDPDMDPLSPFRARDPIVGILCAVCAVGLGVLHMVMGDAPMRMIIINTAAVLVGLGLCLWLAQSRPLREGRFNLMVVVMGAALLATALFGVRAEGAARWVPVAGLVIQPTLLFIPLMLMLHARRGDNWTSAGLALAIAATAAQPDRAMAGVLFAALTALALKASDRRGVALALAAAAGFAVTVFRPDRGGVSAFVDRIHFTAFELHPVAGFALAIGSLLLVVPALRQAVSGRDPSTALVFGVVWTGVVVAALLGNYPTPLVGYGGSAIVGYLLSVALLGAGVSGETARAGSAGMPEVESDAGDARVALGL